MSVHFDEFIDLFGSCLKRSALFEGRRKVFEILINPAAGVFQKPRRMDRAIKSLKTGAESLLSQPAMADVDVRFHYTESTSHAQETALQIISDLAEEQWTDVKVLVLAGGDGFHKDVGTAIVRSRPELLSRLVLFRLPLGTGNDTADCENMAEARELLCRSGQIASKNYLCLEAPGIVTDYAFNVVSFGLDAYVCVLTERWKKRVRKDIYRLAVDLSALFYDFVYQILPMKVWVEQDGVKKLINQRNILTVFGAHGSTTYGGKKRILPGKENLLLTRFIAIPRRISLKGKFMKGSHRNMKETAFFTTEKITVDYPGDILAELDGEVLLLRQENFPLTVTRKKNTLQVLQ